MKLTRSWIKYYPENENVLLQIILLDFIDSLQILNEHIE